MKKDFRHMKYSDAIASVRGVATNFNEYSNGTFQFFPPKEKGRLRERFEIIVSDVYLRKYGVSDGSKIILRCYRGKDISEEIQIENEEELVTQLSKFNVLQQQLSLF